LNINRPWPLVAIIGREGNPYSIRKARKFPSRTNRSKRKKSLGLKLRWYRRIEQ